MHNQRKANKRFTRRHKGLHQPCKSHVPIGERWRYMPLRYPVKRTTNPTLLPSSSTTTSWRRAGNQLCPRATQEPQTKSCVGGWQLRSELRQGRGSVTIRGIQTSKDRSFVVPYSQSSPRPAETARFIRGLASLRTEFGVEICNFRPSCFVQMLRSRQFTGAPLKACQRLKWSGIHSDSYTSLKSMLDSKDIHSSSPASTK